MYRYVHTAVSRGHARMKDVVAVPYTATYQLAVLHRMSTAFRRQHKRWVHDSNACVGFCA